MTHTLTEYTALTLSLILLLAGWLGVWWIMQIMVGG